MTSHRACAFRWVLPTEVPATTGSTASYSPGILYVFVLFGRTADDDSPTHNNGRWSCYRYPSLPSALVAALKAPIIGSLVRASFLRRHQVGHGIRHWRPGAVVIETQGQAIYSWICRGGSHWFEL